MISCKSLVVEDMSQLLFLLLHPPGGSVLYRPPGLRMLSRGEPEGDGQYINPVCKYAFGLLYGKYGLSLS